MSSWLFYFAVISNLIMAMVRGFTKDTGLVILHFGLACLVIYLEITLGSGV